MVQVNFLHVFKTLFLSNTIRNLGPPDSKDREDKTGEDGNNEEASKVEGEYQ